MNWGEFQLGEKLLVTLQIAYAGSCFAPLPYVVFAPIYYGLLLPIGIFLIPLGILELLTAYGIFSMRRWGRSMCKALAVGGILMTLFGFTLSVVFSPVGLTYYSLFLSGLGFSPILLVLLLPTIFPGIAGFYSYGIIMGLDLTLVMASLLVNWSVLSYLRKPHLAGLRPSPN